MAQPPSPALVAELAPTPWQPVRALATGGMATVHVVRHRVLGHEAVMKLIRPASDDQADELTRRLLREGRVVKGLRHENIVEVLDSGFTASGRAYMVAEKLDGDTLKEAVRMKGPLRIEQAADIVKQMLAGLAYAHRAGIVHRDIKPDNVMLLLPDEHGHRRVKLLDFGIVKIVSEQVKLRVGGVVPTAEGLLLGTPSFTSPEQIAAKHIDARADVYGTGGVLYYLLTGRPPFLARDLNELLVAQLSQEPDPPSRLRAQISPALDAVVLKALAKNPDDRFVRSEAMAEALADALSGKTRQTATELLDAPTIPLDASYVAEIEREAAATPSSEPGGEKPTEHLGFTTPQVIALAAAEAAKAPAPPVATVEIPRGRPRVATLPMSAAASPARALRPISERALVPSSRARLARSSSRQLVLRVAIGLVLGLLVVGALQLWTVLR